MSKTKANNTLAAIDHLDIWSGAWQKKAGTGRGRNGKLTPYGIQKLRELILELAVRGRLVPQDPNDEPASVLLKKIAEEKVRLVKEGKIKKQKKLPEIAEEGKPFELPEGWEYAKLGDLATKITDGVHHTPNYLESGVPFISVKDIDGKTISFKNCKYISKTQHQEINARCNPEYGDILICRIGTLGRATIVDTDKPFSLFVSVGLIKFPKEHLLSEYLHLVLHSPLLTNQFKQIKAGGSHTNKLNLNDIPKLVIPLPPLAEQHRIVAKVDELMTLCDRLEQEQTDSLEAHKTLVETLLRTLTEAPDAKAAQQAWTRIAQHFDTLFTTEHSIDQLKQTILQLAVMGKLVPQDPNDEPASVLLEKIAEEKARLVKEEGLKTKAKNEIDSEEEFIEKRDGWEYLRLGNLAKFIDYRGRTPKKTDEGVPLITAKNVRFGYISREPSEFISEEEYTTWMTRGLPRVGDILFTTEAPLGNVAIVDINEKFALAQRVICFQLHAPEIGPYLRLLLMSSAFQQQLSDKATGMTATGIKAAKLKEIPVPIPPLPEQQRIVAKVDEIMALCDALKARIQDAQTTRLNLADAVVSRAVAG